MVKKFPIGKINFDKAMSLAVTRATEHHMASLDLFEKERFPEAYTHLVYCLEECAKRRICMVYQNYNDDDSKCWGGNGVALNSHISERKVLDMFSKHSEKQITILTQSLFNLANTHDMKFRQKVMDSINHSNPFLLDEVRDLMDTFNEIQDKREHAVYSDYLGEEKYDFKKEYSRLFHYVDDAVRRINQFTTQAFCEYPKTEEKVLKMVKKFKESKSESNKYPPTKPQASQ